MAKNKKQTQAIGRNRKRKSHLYLGKETYGDLPKDECFKRAFEPYFTDKNKGLINY